jgi:hypothetical protein
MTQAQSCSLETGTVVSIKFKNQPSAWSCDGLQGSLDCNMKRLAFTMTLAQVIRVSASGISFQSSDSAGIVVTLQCSSMLQNGRILYVTSDALLNAVQQYCNTLNSLCQTDAVLREFDWNTVSVVQSAAARVIMSITAYNKQNCTDAEGGVGNNSAPNPFTFDDQSCFPGAVFDHNQLYFKAESCASNSSKFAMSLNAPSCTARGQVGVANKLATFRPGACVAADEFFTAAGLSSAISALIKRGCCTQVPTAFVFSCQSIPPPSSSSSACANGKLCLAVSDTVFYAIIAVLLAHAVQAAVWTVFAKKSRKFTFAGFVLVSALPFVGTVAWVFMCRSSSPATLSSRYKASISSSLLHRISNSQEPEEKEFMRLAA